LGTTKVPKIQHPLQKKKKSLISPCCNSQWLKRKSILNYVHHLFWLRAIARENKFQLSDSFFPCLLFFWDMCDPQNFGDGIAN
jgi:hypothetical protein